MSFVNQATPEGWERFEAANGSQLRQVFNLVRLRVELCGFDDDAAVQWVVDIVTAQLLSWQHENAKDIWEGTEAS